MATATEAIKKQAHVALDKKLNVTASGSGSGAGMGTVAAGSAGGMKQPWASARPTQQQAPVIRAGAAAGAAAAAAALASKAAQHQQQQQQQQKRTPGAASSPSAPKTAKYKKRDPKGVDLANARAQKAQKSTQEMDVAEAATKAAKAALQQRQQRQYTAGTGASVPPSGYGLAEKHFGVDNVHESNRRRRALAIDDLQMIVQPDTRTPFSGRDDAFRRLMPFHVRCFDKGDLSLLLSRCCPRSIDSIT